MDVTAAVADMGLGDAVCLLWHAKLLPTMARIGLVDVWQSLKRAAACLAGASLVEYKVSMYLDATVIEKDGLLFID